MTLERLRVIRGHLTPTSVSFVPTRSTIENDVHFFKYTLPNRLLSYEQRQFYEENGFIVIPKLIPDELLDECSARFIDLCEGREPKGGITLMKDVSLMKSGAKGQYLYNKAQDIVYDDVFEKYIFYPKLVDYVSCFTGPNVKAVHTMLINKPPDAGSLTSRHPLHQDLYYFPFRPEDRIVAAWTAMEQISVDNGCLTVLPGTHKGPLLQHDYPKWECVFHADSEETNRASIAQTVLEFYVVKRLQLTQFLNGKGGVNKAYHGVLGYDDHKTIPVLMEKGDTVLFHPLLIHGSGANVTQGFRKAISCHYAASDCYYIDVKGTLQESIAKEIEEISRKRGFTLDVQRCIGESMSNDNIIKIVGKALVLPASKKQDILASFRGFGKTDDEKNVIVQPREGRLATLLPTLLDGPDMKDMYIYGSVAVEKPISSWDGKHAVDLLSCQPRK